MMNVAWAWSQAEEEDTKFIQYLGLFSQWNRENQYNVKQLKQIWAIAQGNLARMKKLLLLKR